MGLGLFLVAYQAITDDGYITLAFARNLAFHGQWAVTRGLLSNTATSPLYVLVLSAVTVVTRSPVMSLGVVLAASLATTATLVSLTARRCGWSWWAGPIVAVLLATSPLMASTLGLESFLLVALLVWLLYAVVCGRPGWVGGVCGLVVLTRPDAAVFAVFAVLALVVMVRPVGAGQIARTVFLPPVVALAVVTPWAVASIALFGTPIPDTFIWKADGKGLLGGKYFYEAAPLFLKHWPAATALTLVLYGLGVLALLMWIVRAPLHPVTILVGGGGLAHFGTMSALGVGSFSWYYAPSLVSGTLLVTFGLAAAGRRRAGGGFALDQQRSR